MNTRFLRVNISTPLKAKMNDDHLTLPKLADKLGIARSTLESILNDDWKHIRRGAIEKVADYVGLSANEIFELVPVDFWEPIIKAGQCTFLRGSGSVGRDIPVARWDKVATVKISEFLHEALPGFKTAYERDHITAKDENELLDLARNENCIVIGSPKSNLACEILVSHLFDAKPFDSSQDNRKKIPFGFCWPEDTQPANEDIVQKSSLTCSRAARKEIQNGFGIALKDVHVPVHYLSAEEYKKWHTKTGKDCGLVLVANSPFGSTKDVKLIVLAGYSGVGTVAAAQALIKSFRALEPLPGKPCYGVVEARYWKDADSENREYREFFWRYRHGGLLPGRWSPKGKKAGDEDAD